MERTPPPRDTPAGRPVFDYGREGSGDVTMVTHPDAILPQEEVAFCRRFGGLAMVLVVPVVLFVLFVAVGFVRNIMRTIRGWPTVPAASMPATTLPTTRAAPSLPPDTQPDR